MSDLFRPFHLDPRTFKGMLPDHVLELCRTIYKKEALRLHPDKGGDIETFKELNEAMSSIQGLFDAGKLKLAFKKRQAVVKKYIIKPETIPYENLKAEGLSLANPQKPHILIGHEHYNALHCLDCYWKNGIAYVLCSRYCICRRFQWHEERVFNKKTKKYCLKRLPFRWRQKEVKDGKHRRKPKFVDEEEIKFASKPAHFATDGSCPPAQRFITRELEEKAIKEFRTPLSTTFSPDARVSILNLSEEFGKHVFPVIPIKRILYPYWTIWKVLPDSCIIPEAQIFSVYPGKEIPDFREMRKLWRDILKLREKLGVPEHEI